MEGHPCSVAFVYESDNAVVSQRSVETLKLPTSFHSNQARIKFGTGQCAKELLCDIAPTNSCHLLLRWHDFILKRTILMNVAFEAWGTWNEVEIYDTKECQEGSTHVEGENRKRKNRKRRNINYRRKGNWRKRKGSKEKDDGKGSRKAKVFNRRPHMFICIHLRKREQCCKPKICGETSVTNKLSSESSKDQIQYKTMCEGSIMWYCSHKLLSSSFYMGMTSF